MADLAVLLALSAWSSPRSPPSPSRAPGRVRVGAAPTAPNGIAFDYFVHQGLTEAQAAGIVGNLDQESGMDPGAVQAGGPGRGIAQWSVGGRWDTDANDNVLWYATSRAPPSGTLALQLSFVWFELTTFPYYGLSALRQTTDVTDATVVFETDFEGCSECDQSDRITYAEQALAAYGHVPGHPDRTGRGGIRAHLGKLAGIPRRRRPATP